MASIILLSVLGIANLFLGFLRSNRMLLPAAMVILLIVFGANLYDWNAPAQSYFNNMLTIDRFSVAFTGIVVLTTLLLLPFSQKYVRDNEANLAEYYSLLLFSLVGAIMMVSYDNLLMLFVGIEILSISMYVVAGSDKRNVRSNEASLKYFLMGSFATGILLFGIALVYGSTGAFQLSEIGMAVTNPANDSLRPMLYIGILLMLIGIGFKVSAAPFHYWTPDVYEGTPTFFAAFMSTVVKTAGFAAFLKLLVQAFPAAQGFWIPTIVAMCALTLLIGNVGAVAQQSVKRMLAYSSISHAGYLLIGLVAFNGELSGLSANGIFFYSLAYSIATIAAFAVLKLVHDQRQREDYDGLNGLARTNPLLAFVMTIAMLSLAGIPLTGGFFGKFFLFGAAVDKGYIGLVVFAVIMSMVGIYYYLRPIIAMYMKPADNEADTPIAVGGFQSAVLIALVVLTVVLGVLPGLVSGVL
ncbi:NADH-quinone oxidoreductase subunit N [Hymenobacter qilianensis]|uniref:NADH-quinone oxidoreductase subunit N n=2 Tax=Hymenobacter qilianensis TaxID=1385715 RepID=A0A7H0GX75_9BACT|nr:NADH-quinone oxidoreductase subunit N [Hymenobacter qilianensis]QNP52891.1 NADH-quinone oxidoreductase subunit N [Hymenobacter qilianensis]GGF71566.1 NADH-quinone oxidoreductase subunit N [Hymenobacter qilianensis]